MNIPIESNGYSSVHCYDEWTPLKEVFLASVLGANHTVDATFRCFYGKTNVGSDVHHFSLSDNLIYRRQAEFQGLKTVLESRGVVVREQQGYEFLTPFSTPYWKAYSRPSDNPRDQLLVLGDTIVETPPIIRSRYFENDAWKPHLYGYFSAGSRWITAPRPVLNADSFDPPLEPDCETPLKIGTPEILFDAAQIFKVGLDVLMNVRNTNDHLGFQWVRREFPQYRWHAVNLGPNSDHIDGELAILRPGLLLVGHRLIGKIDLLPDFMQSWDVVPMLDREEHNYGLQLASDNIYINVLSLDENTVIISEDAHITIRNLERKGIECIRIPFHDSTAFGGGIHCSTLDIRRAGNLEDYTQ